MIVRSISKQELTINSIRQQHQKLQVTLLGTVVSKLSFDIPSTFGRKIYSASLYIKPYETKIERIPAPKMILLTYTLGINSVFLKGGLMIPSVNIYKMIILLEIKQARAELGQAQLILGRS